MVTVWTFNTARFSIELLFDFDIVPDTSFDETGETQAKLESGEWVAFDSIVRVQLDGRTIGHDSLGESIYEYSADFFKAHRDKDPLNRNCTIMRESWGGDVVICHYFPDMVRSAIADARTFLASQPTSEGVTV